jgi:hypothetical protein
LTTKEVAMTTDETTTTEQQITSTIRELWRRHPERDKVEIERWTRAEFWVHADDPIQDFVPLLALRAVEDRLRSTPPGVTHRPRTHHLPADRRSSTTQKGPSPVVG